MQVSQQGEYGLILAVNAGSSSLKISLYNPFDLTPSHILSASFSNLSSPPAKFSVDHNPAIDLDSVTDHASAFAYFMKYLNNEASIYTHQLAYICHRVVHGGDYTDQIRVVINPETYHHIEALSDLAPLHNGAALSVIKACISNLPETISVAYFDTSFHRSIPPHITAYPIDQSTARQRALKKYGFHGLSYSYIVTSVSSFLSKSSLINLIVLHLGSGASACAIQDSRSIDTSMGLTPLDGLPGATRSGAVDPSLIFHYTNKAGRISHDPSMASNLHITEAEDILNRKSGWKALTGTTDFRLITQRAFADPDSPDRLAFDLFVDRVLNYIGSYYLKLGGEVDALVFAGMIGEKSKELREAVGKKVACLGFKLDEKKNEGVDDVKGNIVDIGTGEAGGKRMLVCRTNEQYEMARLCAWDRDFYE